MITIKTKIVQKNTLSNILTQSEIKHQTWLSLCTTPITENTRHKHLVMKKINLTFLPYHKKNTNTLYSNNYIINLT